jgi:hypothetical protein
MPSRFEHRRDKIGTREEFGTMEFSTAMPVSRAGLRSTLRPTR